MTFVVQALHFYHQINGLLHRGSLFPGEVHMQKIPCMQTEQMLEVGIHQRVHAGQTQVYTTNK